MCDLRLIKVKGYFTIWISAIALLNNEINNTFYFNRLKEGFVQTPKVIFIAYTYVWIFAAP